jgi:hypothetical protein
MEVNHATEGEEGETDYCNSRVEAVPMRAISEVPRDAARQGVRQVRGSLELGKTNGLV